MLILMHRRVARSGRCTLLHRRSAALVLRCCAAVTAMSHGFVAWGAIVAPLHWCINVCRTTTSCRTIDVVSHSPVARSLLVAPLLPWFLSRRTCTSRRCTLRRSSVLSSLDRISPTSDSISPGNRLERAVQRRGEVARDLPGTNAVVLALKGTEAVK